MKNLIIITAILFVSYFAQAQQQEKSYDDIVYLGLPSYLKKPNNAEIKNFIENRKSLLIEPSTKNVIYYTSGEIILHYVAYKSSTSNNTLADQKNFYDYMNQQGTGATSYSSEIRNINSNNVLVVQYDNPKTYCGYRIIAINAEKNKRTIIYIDYKLSDKAEAQKIADSILANLRFEEAPVRPKGPTRAN